LEAAGLPVPKTRIIHMPPEAQEYIWKIFDGADPDWGTAGGTACQNFVMEVQVAGEEMGWPCFLRTDYTSHKHDWEKTCFLKRPESVTAHVLAIVEFSEMADLLGMPWDVWAVREMLPTIPLGVCDRYGNMPVCREFRFFVQDGQAKCFHPYWPRPALDSGMTNGIQTETYIKTAAVDRQTKKDLKGLAESAGAAVDGGDWSIDLLETKNGWYVTDMAAADTSFHWEGCPNA
jgi:hypothetical protein